MQGKHASNQGFLVEKNLEGSLPNRDKLRSIVENTKFVWKIRCEARQT
jgi:hypothetical protein